MLSVNLLERVKLASAHNRVWVFIILLSGLLINKRGRPPLFHILTQVFKWGTLWLVLVSFIERNFRTCWWWLFNVCFDVLIYLLLADCLILRRILILYIILLKWRITMVEFWRLLTLWYCLMLDLVQDLLLKNMGVLQALGKDIKSFLDVVDGPFDHRETILERLNLIIIIFRVPILRIIRAWAALNRSCGAGIIRHCIWQFLTI